MRERTDKEEREREREMKVQEVVRAVKEMVELLAACLRAEMLNCFLLTLLLFFVSDTVHM